MERHWAMAHSATSPFPMPVSVGVGIDQGPMGSDATESEFDKMCTNMATQLKDKMRKHPKERTCYVALGDILQIFNEYSTKALFRAFEPYSSDEDRDQAICLLHQRQPEDDSAAYRYLRGFATLIYMENKQYIHLATYYFLQPSRVHQWVPPEDNSSRETITKACFYKGISNPYDGFYDHFFEKKPLFCALVLKPGRNVAVAEVQQLPFFCERSKRVGAGGAGKVYKVKVGKHHWVEGSMSNQEDRVLAVKKFSRKKAPDHRFALEEAILTKLGDANTESKHIILPMATLVHGPERYFIYELAEMDLQRYMEEITRNSPKDDSYRDQTTTVLKNTTGLVSGLHWIHTCELPGEMARILHRDIKPNNILIIVGHDSKEVWKLADFDRATEQSRWSSEVLPGNPRDEQAYRAPDIIEGKWGRRGDVWAMGCIVTEILSWLDSGNTGVNGFWEGRATRNGVKQSAERFYTVSSNGSTEIPSTFVKSWLQQLIKRAKERAEERAEGGVQDRASGQATDPALADFLEWYHAYVMKVIDELSEKVLVPRALREGADKFYDFMSKAYKSQQTPPQHQSPSPASSSRSQSRSQAAVSAPIHSREPTAANVVPNSERTPRSGDGSGGQRGGNSANAPEPQNCWLLCSLIDNNSSPPNDLSLWDKDDLNKCCFACGHVLIHKAIKKKSEVWFRKLLEIDQVDINQKNGKDGGLTPIMTSALKEWDYATDILLAKKCNLPSKEDMDQIRSFTTRRNLNKKVEKERRRRM